MLTFNAPRAHIDHVVCRYDDPGDGLHHDRGCGICTLVLALDLPSTTHERVCNACMMPARQFPPYESETLAQAVTRLIASVITTPAMEVAS